MDPLTPEKRHNIMSAIHSKDTSIEVLLRKALWHRGHRYRKNYKKLPGKPDIAITKYRIAVFCDSEFFHGKEWDALKARLEKGSKGEYWIKKITRNMERDRENEQALRNMDWVVLRFWGDDIKKHTEECVREIEEAIFEQMVGAARLEEEPNELDDENLPDADSPFPQNS